MMLQTKIKEKIIFNSYRTIFISFILLLLSSFIFFFSLKNNFFENNILFNAHYFYGMPLFDNLNNIDILGQVLYNYFLSGVLIAGIVLLVAVIGAITLTFNFNSHRKNQVISRQLSRAIVCIRRFRS